MSNLNIAMTHADKLCYAAALHATGTPLSVAMEEAGLFLCPIFGRAVLAKSRGVRVAIQRSCGSTW